MSERHYIPGMTGCSDGGCIFNYKPPGTMVTNGGCQCQKELQRTDEGWKAVRTIIYLRRELMGLNMHQLAPVVTHEIPKRTMLHKVNMIKEIREKALCGLKEAKEAMDKVYPSCWEYDQVIEKAVALLNGTKGYCIMGDNCHCGGDVPAVREGCFEWHS